MAGDDLNNRERMILECIRAYRSEFGYPPTVRDIQSRCAISSPSLVHGSLNSLAEKGYIKKDGRRTRGIVLADDTIGIPILGTIAAGKPIPVPDEEVWDIGSIADKIDVNEYIIGNHHNVYALKVRGLSMIDAFVNDGDIVLIEQTGDLNDGEMGAVWIKDENSATLKYVFKEGGMVRLQPANSQMKPIMKPAVNVVIQGRVIGVIRKV